MKDKPTHWRSFAELEQTPEFREASSREFVTPPEVLPPDAPARRRFLKVMGASFALAGVTTGCRWKEDHLVPFTKRPEGTIPGEPKYFATAMELDGIATGLLAKSYDGRPIKVDGNPQHPTSLGAASVFHQAAVLELYDPDRAERITRREGGGRVEVPAAQFETFVSRHFAELAAKGGEGLRFLAEPSSSPSREDMKRRLLGAFPRATWIDYCAAHGDNARSGSLLAFGVPYHTYHALENAKVVLTLDADLLAPSNPTGLVNARAIAARREPDSGEMSRIYSVESAVTLTGAVADHRLALRSELIRAFAAALDAQISAKAQALPEMGPAQPKPAAAFLGEPRVAKFLEVVVKDLLANVGACAVVAGAGQPPEVHALAHRINALLGNVGRTIKYVVDSSGQIVNRREALKALTDEMNAGKVDTLVVIGENPAYTAPADLGFSAAMAKVKTTIVASGYLDETARLATWHVPLAHFLETWNDSRGHDGTITIGQPLIAPLFGGHSCIELLATFIRDPKSKGLDILRRTHAVRLPTERRWRRAVYDGFIDGTAHLPAMPKLKPLAAIALGPRELAGSKVGNGQLELVFAPDNKLYDGRYANNGWLQELPEQITKVTWSNAALISPGTAAELGIKETNLVELSLGGRKVALPAIFSPGQADGSILVALGYGRTAAGNVGGLPEKGVEPIGADTYALRTLEGYDFAVGLSVRVVGDGTLMFASTQELHAIDQIGANGRHERLGELIRETNLERFKEEPDFVKEAVEHPPLLDLWVSPVSYDGHKWGMSIDLNRCIGCSACVTACQAENNIPVVGRDNVRRGREMLWLRIDRYYSGPPEAPEVSFQPMPCQQCENAPCEEVCPVGATQHSHEGLNDMVYNRCIGTRYCSNNCPYKVRRFNFFNYQLNRYQDTVETTPFQSVTDPKKTLRWMVYNPEVTVRARGVMEKCTFCVQRIQNVKIKAKNAKRPIEDGEIRTACQQTCPADAIVFGDLNDPKARVTAKHALSRAYALLEELNNRPRVRYLGKVRNPHPELT